MNLVFGFRFVLIIMILFFAPSLTHAAEELESRQTMNSKGLEKKDRPTNKKEFSRGTRKLRKYASFAGGD